MLVRPGLMTDTWLEPVLKAHSAVTKVLQTALQLLWLGDWMPPACRGLYHGSWMLLLSTCAMSSSTTTTVDPIHGWTLFMGGCYCQPVP
jgi:hypothetical protein